MQPRVRSLNLTLGCLFAAAGPASASEAEELRTFVAEQAVVARELALAPARVGLPDVRVMSQNLYIGLDVFPIISAPPEQIPFVVAESFADFVANRPSDRL